MNKEQTAIKSWMSRAGQATPERPEIPDQHVRALRARLIFEEAMETIAALGISVRLKELALPIDSGLVYFLADCYPNLIELADGIADLQVVNLGTAVACGIDIEPVFDEVQSVSNESKFNWPIDELKAARDCGYRVEDLENGQFCVTDGMGKILKSTAYKKANITPIIEAQSK